jgi:hypothetical protein
MKSRWFTSSPVSDSVQFFVACLCISERAASLYDAVILRSRSHGQEFQSNHVGIYTKDRIDSACYSRSGSDYSSDPPNTDPRS